MKLLRITGLAPVAAYARPVSGNGIGMFQGPQFVLFGYNPNPGAGHVDVDWFQFSDNRDATGGSQASSKP